MKNQNKDLVDKSSNNCLNISYSNYTSDPDLQINANLVRIDLAEDHDSYQKFKFRHPKTRNELASYYLHFMGPKPFYKTYSYV